MGGGQVWGFLGGHGSWDTGWGAPGSHLQPTRTMLQPGRVHCTQVPVYREHRNPSAARATCSLRPQGALGAQTRVLQEPHPPGPPPSSSASTLRRAFSCKRGLGRSAAVALRGSGRNWVRPRVRLSPTACTFSMTGLTGIQSESRILQDPRGQSKATSKKDISGSWMCCGVPPAELAPSHSHCSPRLIRACVGRREQRQPKREPPSSPSCGCAQRAKRRSRQDAVSKHCEVTASCVPLTLAFIPPGQTCPRSGER